jgi:hypothetical protein
MDLSTNGQHGFEHVMAVTGYPFFHNEATQIEATDCNVI